MSFMINPYWFSAGSTPPSSGFGFRYGYEFDGVDEYIDFGNVITFDRNNAFSFSFWFKVDTTAQTGMIISKVLSSGTYQGVLILLQSSRINFFINDGLGGPSNAMKVHSSVLSANTWHHFTATYDGSSLRSGMNLYNNSSLDNAYSLLTSISGNINASTSFNIAARNNTTSNTLLGRVDDVQFYDFELNSTQVSDIYNSGYVTAPTASPVHHWKLGEEDTFSTNWTVKDSVGSLDGTSVNMEEEDRKLGVAYSMEFDGVNEAVTFGDVLETDYDEPVSWSLWFKPISSGGDIIQKMSNANSYRGFNITMDGSKPQFRLVNTISSNWIRKRGNTNLVVGNWFHMVCTYDGSGLNTGAKIYINGVEESYGAYTGTLSATILNSNPLEFNRSTTYSFLTRSNINLMEVSQYTSELSASDVALLYNTTGTNNGVPIDPRDVGLSPSFYTPLGGQNDSFSTNWTIVDEINGNNGTSVNMEEADKTSYTP